MKAIVFCSLIVAMSMNSSENPLPPIKPRTFREKLISLQEDINHENHWVVAGRIIQLHLRAELYGESRDRAIANRLLSLVVRSRYSDPEA